MTMNVIDLTTSIKPVRPLATRHPNSITTIVFHHTASGTDVSPQAFHTMHVTRGWNTIGYHYLVYVDGKIYKTRPVLTIPACVEGHNTRIICIAGVGNWETLNPTTMEFIDSCAWLVTEIWKSLSKLPIVGHRDLMPTSCPGRNFPLSEVRHAADRLFSASDRRADV